MLQTSTDNFQYRLLLNFGATQSLSESMTCAVAVLAMMSKEGQRFPV